MIRTNWYTTALILALGSAAPLGRTVLGSDAEERSLSVMPVEQASGDASAGEKPIQDLLVRYVSAIESRNIDALKRVWPTMTPAQTLAIRGEFDHARALRVELLDQRTTIKDNTAVVLARRRYVMTTPDGKNLESVTATTFTLRLAAAGWVIETIRYQL